MKLKDYLFQRLLLTYKSSYQATNYLSFLDIILFSPLGFIFIVFAGRLGKWAGITAIGSYLVLIVLLNIRRYENKRRILQVVRKYRDNKYNTYIKNWMIYIFPFLFTFLYLFIIKTIIDLLKII